MGDAKKTAASAGLLEYMRAITVFVKVVEKRSFRAGAAALGLSPSVASHHISRLEAQVGTALLYRSTRKLTLTPAGERLLESVRPLLESTEHTLGELAAESESGAGPLRVTMPTPVALGPVLPLLWEFTASHRGVRLSVHIEDGRQDLVSERFDLAIRMGHHDTGALKTRVLHVARCVLVSSPAYAASMPPPQRPADLADWRWVQHLVRPATIELRHPRHGSEAVSARDMVTTNAALAVLQLAIAGAGVAALPLTVAQTALADGRLIQVLPEWSLPQPSVAAFWPVNSAHRSITSRLVDFLQERTRVVPTPLTAKPLARSRITLKAPLNLAPLPEVTGRRPDKTTLGRG